MALNVLALLDLVLAAHAVKTAVKINFSEISTTNCESDDFNATGHYEFVLNELAVVECKTEETGVNTFRVKDEPSLIFEKSNESYILMYMKMRADSDGKYIECHHNKSSVVFIVRIMLKRKPTETNKDQWILKVDNKIWSPPPPFIYNYPYIKHETFNITCETVGAYNSNDTQGEDGGYLNMKYDPSIDNQKDLKCPKTTSNYTSLYGRLLHMKGIRGLSSSNILYYYYTFKGNVAIHYEYQDEQTLELKWVHKVHKFKRQYKVFWKGALVPRLTSKNLKDPLEIDPITLGSEDDGSIILFTVNKMPSDVFIYNIHVVLRRMVPIPELVPRDNNLDVTNSSSPAALPVGACSSTSAAVAVGTVVGASLTAFVFVIKRRCTKRPPRPPLALPLDANEQHIYDCVYSHLPRRRRDRAVRGAHRGSGTSRTTRSVKPQ